MYVLFLNGIVLLNLPAASVQIFSFVFVKSDILIGEIRGCLIFGLL